MKRISSMSLFRHNALWLLAVMLLSTACSKSDDYVYVDDTKSNDGKVKVTVTDSNGTASSITAGREMGIYITDADGNVTFLKVSVGQDGFVVLPTDAQSKKMLAYLPYQNSWDTEDLPDFCRFHVESDQSTETGYQASDLMVGKAEAGDTAGMSFTHMLAQLVIHIVDETGANDFQTCSVKLRDVQDAVDVDLQKPSVATVADSKADITMFPYVVSDHRLSLKAIVAPQQVEAGERFVVFVNNGHATRYSIPHKADLQGGKTYTISMRLTNKGLEFVGSTVVDWDETVETTIDI